MTTIGYQWGLLERSSDDCFQTWKKVELLELR